MICNMQNKTPVLPQKHPLLPTMISIDGTLVTHEMKYSLLYQLQSLFLLEYVPQKMLHQLHTLNLDYQG